MIGFYSGSSKLCRLSSFHCLNITFLIREPELTESIAQNNTILAVVDILVSFFVFVAFFWQKVWRLFIFSWLCLFEAMFFLLQFRFLGSRPFFFLWKFIKVFFELWGVSSKRPTTSEFYWGSRYLRRHFLVRFATDYFFQAESRFLLLSSYISWHKILLLQPND